MNSPAVEHRHTLSAPPPGLTREVRTDWIEMGMTTRSPDHYDPDLAADLPEPVRRWLAHAIVPGTPLLSSVELTSHGRLRLGSWREFTATQRQTAALGYVWAGDTRMYGLPATGFERYRRGIGETEWKLLRSVRLRTASGPDVARSTAGRHAAELIMGAPASALSKHVTWASVDSTRAVGRLRVGATVHEITIEVAGSGALTSISMPRWGSLADGSYAERLYGVELTDEETFDGFTVPCGITASWDQGTDPQAEYTVDHARYR